MKRESDAGNCSVNRIYEIGHEASPSGSQRDTTERKREAAITGI